MNRFSLLGKYASAALAVGALALASMPAQAITVLGGTVTAVGADSLTIVKDGTVRTVFFDDATRVTVCFNQPGAGTGLPAIQDGTSNTFLIGEGVRLPLQLGDVFSYQPINQIVDGTSNTIFLGEGNANELCARDGELLPAVQDGTSNTILIGEQTDLDICVSNSRSSTIVDGTSNTITFAERGSDCFTDLQIVAAVSEPASLAPLAGGLLLLLAGGPLGRRAYGAARSASARS